MAMFFDQDFDYARRRLTLFKHITNRYSDLRESLTVLSFADARYHYPLQAADLLAWETRRHLINLVEGERETARWRELMAALPSGEFNYEGEYWDKKLIDSELPKVEKS
jgi:hypothetical protein